MMSMKTYAQTLHKTPIPPPPYQRTIDVSDRVMETQHNPFNDYERVEIQNIKATLKRYLAINFADNIHDNEQFESYMKHAIIAGGCFTSLFHDEDVNDIDIFILDHGAKPELKYLIDNLKKANVSYTEVYQSARATKINEKIERVYNVTSHNFQQKSGKKGLKYQFIFTSYKSREELLSHFDYVHAMVSYVPYKDNIYLTRRAYDAIKNKRLIVNGNNKIEQWRQEKFEERGWKKPETKPFGMEAFRIG